MRTPPALVFTPAASWVYRAVAVAVALYLIAICVHLARSGGGFDWQNAGLGLFCLGVTVWLLHDAWRLPRASLRYTHGQWFCSHDGQERQGTLQVHLDLQSYLLVRFVPPQHNNSIFRASSQWFHLEARHASLSPSLSPAASHAVADQPRSGSWLALRRAVYAPAVADHESVAA